MNETPNWYVAHLVCCWSFLDGRQDLFSIWESVYLISAIDLDEAKQKANQYGRAEEIPPREEDPMTIEGRPVYLKYAGIRKISKIECSDHGPNTGTVLSQFKLRPIDDVDYRALLKGDEADIVLYPEHIS